MECPDKQTMVEERVDRILTQYRESPNLIGIIRHDLAEIADIIVQSCAMPSEFDILDAVGDQLTIIGKRLGWPRCHCICVAIPVFGFSCGVIPVTSDGEVVTSDGAIVTTGGTDSGESYNTNKPILGFCSGAVWSDCQEAGVGDICLDDDEVYRNYLLARRYQARQLWDIDSLQAAAWHLWGPTATVVSMGGARVAIQPGRDLTPMEQVQLPVAFRVLPLAPGITPHISYETGSIFGFGIGWGGLCEGAKWLCPQEIDPYNCA